MTPIEFLILCFLIQMFFWSVGIEHNLHNERWYVTALLAIMTLSVIVLLSTLKGIF